MKTCPEIIFASALRSDVCVFAAAQPPILGASSSETQSPPAEFVWMPKGKHAISAGTADGKGFQGEVLVDEAGFRAVVASFERSIAAGKRVWVDFNHEDRDAAAWIQSFAWDATRGILASVEWTVKGAEALKEKLFYSFSPVFTRDRETSRVTGIWEGHAAGGLVNKPAFGAAMPALIAAQLAGAESANAATGGTPVSKNRPKMNTAQLIALLASLGVKHAPDATEQQLVDLVLAYKPAASADGAVIAGLQSDLNALKTREQIARKRAASAVVQAAVSRGAIKKDDAVGIAKWSALIEADESVSEILAAIPGTAKQGAEVIVAAVPNQGSGAAVSAQPVEVFKAMAAETDPLKRGKIYRDVRQFVTEHSNEVLTVLAANSLGSVAGDIITLRALDLLKLNFPALSAISTDFSAEAAMQGQVIKTRIVSVPSVVTLNDSTGWASSDATTTDVSVTIGQPKGVQIEYGSTELGSTGRNLFAEQVEACHYALGKDLVDAVYALITTAYTNATTKATASVARLDLVAMEKALASRGVAGTLYLLANADIYERLSNDTTVTSLATQQRAEIITGNTLPPIAGFNIIRAINLPATSNLTGFGFRKDAMVLAMRLPEDYVKKAPAGAAHGSQSVVTNPDTGISVQKTDFVDHKLAKAYSRIAWSYGCARAQLASGQRLVSA